MIRLILRLESNKADVEDGPHPRSSTVVHSLSKGMCQYTNAALQFLQAALAHVPHLYARPYSYFNT